MFSITIILFITIMMALVQVSIWQMMPAKLRDILFANPILAFLVNLAGSGLIATFTGVASIVGICNLAASVLFGGYAFLYGKHKGIKGLCIEWHKFLRFIPVFPKLVVVYAKDGKTWTA